jgi:protease IV
MRQFFKYVFATLVGLFLAGLIGILILIGIGASSSSSSKPKLYSNSILTIKTSEIIKEQSVDGSFDMSGATDGSLGLHEMKKAIAAAKTDDKIKGIYLKLEPGMNAWASLYDIRKSLLDFKTSKKFIIAYGEIIDQKSLYLASTADKVYGNPAGVVEWKGIAATGTFFKKALDKLEVNPEIFYCGKFKGATEPYRYEKWSEPNRLQIQELTNTIYSELLQAVSQKCGRDTTDLKNVANTFMGGTANKAAAEKLIDAVKYESEVLAELRTRVGAKEMAKLNFMHITNYINEIPSDKSSINKIAVLFAEGAIVDGEGEEGEVASKPMIRNIRNIAKNKNIKALVLRINSPGGSAMASENIWHELMELRKQKPIIISMGDVAASGGYYIACTGDSIYAQPTTITGSIGVFGIMASFEKFLSNKLGVTTDVVKTANSSDMPNFSRDLTESEKLNIQNSVDSIYLLFKTRVSNARKINLNYTDSIAQGRVYMGAKAKQLKLVDAIGGLDRAIASASAAAKLTDYKVITYPEVKNGLEAFIEKFNGKKSEDILIKKALGAEYATYKNLKDLKAKLNIMQMSLPWSLDIK